ncbi:hypothetical protein TOL_3703 [Thalassolituus oleivorans MIL-1]|uniref:Uncharacterized protein n=1 Tax=Thalassolituus oleivorans MIL-1 TaxID=1298593 RepID=M5EA06_9GAMM|nr:hypothetical protein TOL_3703 [Thalassolituus oleivorans MIL-1]
MAFLSTLSKPVFLRLIDIFLPVVNDSFMSFMKLSPSFCHI